jgi:MarR family
MGQQDEADNDGAALFGALLRIPYSAMAEAVERGLRTAGYPEITRAHLTVLQPLFARPDGARLTELAAWAHITKPSMNYLVNHLAAQGYVERTATVQAVRAIVRETEAAWSDLIGPDHLEQLRRLLRELSVALRGNDSGIR